MKKLFAIILTLSLVFSSCVNWNSETIRGNGNVITETRSASGFSAVEVSGAIHVYIASDSSYSVKVESDENLQPYILVSREGDALRIRQENNTSLSPTGSIKVYVSAPVYRKIGVSGASGVYTQNSIKGDGIYVDLSGASNADLDMNMTGVEVDLSGASNITLRGSGATLRVDGSGSCHVKAADFQVEKAVVELSGAGSAEVNASETLEADLSGASGVVYSGNPKVNAQTSGASSVRSAN